MDKFSVSQWLDAHAKSIICALLSLLLLMGLFWMSYTVMLETAEREASLRKLSQQLPQPIPPAASTAPMLVEEAPAAVFRPAIVCWGDGFTAGVGGNGTGYPELLQASTGLPVYNFGVEGESMASVAMRMGRYPLTVSAADIPAAPTPVPVILQSNGQSTGLLRKGDAGLNPCTIAGVEGTLTQGTNPREFFFTRSEAGEPIAVAADTAVISRGAAIRSPDDIVVLHLGSSERMTQRRSRELIATYQELLLYLNTDRYIIVGLISKQLSPEIEAINAALSENFKAHFLDLRAYLLERGLTDAKLTPTAQDTADLAAKEIPSSLRSGNIYGNHAFYQLYSVQVLEKIEALGFLEQQV